jgi:phage shock protein E
MNWTIVIIAAAIFVVILVVRRAAFVSADVARKQLAQGALVIDVRSTAEFDGGHLPGAINVPLDELEQSLPRHVKDKNQVLLLHCLSGTRSGIAKRQLIDMGYSNVSNLGSLGRARQIVTAARGN